MTEIPRQNNKIYKICKKIKRESTKIPKKSQENSKTTKKLQNQRKIQKQNMYIYIHKIDISVVFCDLNLLLVFCGLTLYILYHSEQGTIDIFSILLIREYLIKCHHN